jgi:hypothetical protein
MAGDSDKRIGKERVDEVLGCFEEMVDAGKLLKECLVMAKRFASETIYLIQESCEYNIEISNKAKDLDGIKESMLNKIERIERTLDKTIRAVNYEEK